MDVAGPDSSCGASVSVVGVWVCESPVLLIQFMHVKCVSARVCVFRRCQTAGGCAKVSVTESLNLQSCQGEQI